VDCDQEDRDTLDQEFHLEFDHTPERHGLRASSASIGSENSVSSQAAEFRIAAAA
jgi:hypothetical protein